MNNKLRGRDPLQQLETQRRNAIPNETQIVRYSPGNQSSNYPLQNQSFNPTPQTQWQHGQATNFSQLYLANGGVSHEVRQEPIYMAWTTMQTHTSFHPQNHQTNAQTNPHLVQGNAVSGNLVASDVTFVTPQFCGYVSEAVANVDDGTFSATCSAHSGALMPMAMLPPYPTPAPTIAVQGERIEEIDTSNETARGQGSKRKIGEVEDADEEIMQSTVKSAPDSHQAKRVKFKSP